MSKWQPIETAPKDGSAILATNAIYTYHLHRCGIYYWEFGATTARGRVTIEAGWRHQNEYDDDAPRETRLTHWMPLPEPPPGEPFASRRKAKLAQQAQKSGSKPVAARS